MRYKKEALALLDSVNSAEQLPKSHRALALRSAVLDYENAVQAAAMANAEEAKAAMLKAKTEHEEGLLAVRAATAQVVAKYVQQVAELQVQIEALQANK